MNAFETVFSEQSTELVVNVSACSNELELDIPHEGGGMSFTTDETLTLSKNGVLSVNTAKSALQDNTLPITSAAVWTEVGNINALLETI